MATFLEKVRSGEAKDLADLAKGNSRLGKILKREGVPKTPELKRVLDLPRYRWQDDPEIPELVEAFTQLLKTPNGTQRLKPVQAAAFKVADENKGAVLAMKMGTGKTHVTYLLPVVLEVERAILLVPNGLLEKTEHHFAELSEHWKGPSYAVFDKVLPKNLPQLMIVGYSDISVEKYSELLEAIDPQLIEADEGFKLAHLDYNPSDKGSATAKRVRRCLSTRDDCMFVVLGGTLCDDRPIMQFHHLFRWALGENMPMPTPSKEALLWARALDIEPHLTERMDLGALSYFGESLEEARQGFYDRLYNTSGVIYTPEVDVNASLRMRIIDGPNPCHQQIIDAFNGKNPKGEPIEDFQIPWLTGELSCGFWYEQDPPPPKEWREAARDWYQLKALMLDQQDPEMESDYQVELKLRRGPPNAVLARWLAVRDLYKPDRITHWLSYKVIDHVVQTADPGTIIWTLYQAPGDMMMRRHKLRYFQKNGCDASGLLIDDYDGSTCVASISACAEGHNLQHKWYRNRTITVPGFLLNEQRIGRTHREFQKADTVYDEYLGNNDLQRHKINRLREKAKQGSKSSRMRIADWEG